MSDSPFSPPPEPDDSSSPTFREPWNPGHIMLLTFFGGMLTGGYLLFRNLDRLGFRSGGRKILLISLAYTVVVIGVGSYLGVDRAKKRHREETLAKVLRETAEESDSTTEAEREVGGDDEGDFVGAPDGADEPAGANPEAQPSEVSSPERDEGSRERESGEEPSLAELLELDDSSMEKKREEDQRFRFLVRNLFAIGAVLIAWVLARPQFPRFQWAMSEGEPIGKLFLPAVGVIVISLLVEVVGVAIGVMIFMSL